MFSAVGEGVETRLQNKNFRPCRLSRNNREQSNVCPSIFFFYFRFVPTMHSVVFQPEAHYF